jgi:uncharacterized protein YyaL (SSP411 family)
LDNSSVTQRKPNRLIDEKSPYLLQHAYNPVDWYPWSNVAFERAQAENKPVLVSIGYSSCHWCHVMEKESFENEEVAELLNRAFVCVKVDREERPDIDAAYMAACQVMGRNCGWPLNVIMTPSKKPFYVASYIPKENRYGTIGLLSLVPQVEELWKHRRAELEAKGIEINEKISFQPKPESEEPLTKHELEEAHDQLYLAFDYDNAGFGAAPKFPSPHNLLFLLRYYNRTKQPAALTMVERTLRAMRNGGLFDQVGLGFHRYSTDAKWLVPHFEKMIYDQALLSLAYLEAYHATGAPKYRITAKETLDYVLRDLKASEGAFFSSEDADSEGEEGRFYLWTLEELKEALPLDLVDFAVRIFGVKPEGNYVEPGRGRIGKNILYIAVPIDQMAAEEKSSIDQVIGKLGKTVALLYQARAKRVRPAKDDKILVDWNGLVIASLARASQVLGDQKYLKEAQNAAEFLLKEMQTDKHHLLHRYVKGEKAVEGFLDDYSFLVYGLIELYEASFDEKYLQSAKDFTEVMIEDFWDPVNGGFYLTGKNSDPAVPRIKQSYDAAYPSGNSIALHDLLRLAALSREEISFEQYANKLLSAFAWDVRGYPMGHTFMLMGLDYLLGPTFNITLVGEKEDKDLQSMLSELRKTYKPNLTVTLWTAEKAKNAPSGLSYRKIEGKATAYVCKGQTCMPPTNKIEEMVEYLAPEEPESQTHKT